jgi:hypothetical protein
LILPLRWLRLLAPISYMSGVSASLSQPQVRLPPMPSKRLAQVRAPLLSRPSPRNDLVADAPAFHVTLWDAAGPKGTFLAGAVFACAGLLRSGGTSFNAGEGMMARGGGHPLQGAVGKVGSTAYRSGPADMSHSRGRALGQIGSELVAALRERQPGGASGRQGSPQDP